MTYRLLNQAFSLYDLVDERAGAMADLRVSVPDGKDCGELAALYEWLSLDPDVGHAAVLSLKPAASRSRAVASGVVVINVVLSDSIAALSAVGALVAAVSRWRTSRPWAPVVQIESVTVAVTVSAADPEVLRQLAARLSAGLPAGADTTDAAGRSEDIRLASISTSRKRRAWSARGFPLLQLASPPRSAAQPAASSGRGMDVPTRLTGVIRECLLWPPQPDSLYVVRPGTREVRQLQKARATHPLEPGEEIIAVWQWARLTGMFSSTPKSLAFTSHGIRVAEARLRLNVPYGAFHEYAFRYEYWPGGRTGPDVCQLVIDGPTPWCSPNADLTAELIADDLTRIKALAAGPD